MDNKYKALPFWSWNDELDEKELVRQIDWMNDSGVGGFFMHARGGLTTPYLGEKWFSCVEACLKRANELGMEAYAYDENGWPSGFVGGKLLEDIENHDAELLYEFGKYDPNSFVSYDVSTDKLIRCTEGENCLNIYFRYSTSTADILNKDVVRKFINETHEQYKKHDIYGNLRGFFTDEPQYYRWGNSYTTVLPKYFKEHYNEDIKDRLGLLFVEKEGFRDFRYKYWKAMQDLMLNSFAKQIYDWCDSNGYKLTGHYVEEGSLSGQMLCCGGIMPFYEYEHIPGIDYLGRPLRSSLSPIQIGSVASQLGKKQILVETFAMTGWDCTPFELKHIAESLYVFGVNLMCHHLLPYSEHGQRKRDYPEHFSAINPWVSDSFKEFNDYFTELGEKIANSDAIVDVAVFHPIRSAYFDCKHDKLWKPGDPVAPLNEKLFNLIDLLGEKQINFHFIDETLLAKYGSVEGDVLRSGKCTYKYIIFPKMYTMDKSSDVLLKQYSSNGGKILFMYEKPTYLEGEEHNYDYLNSNTTLDEIKSSQMVKPLDNKNIRFAVRKDETGKTFVYAVNFDEETTWTPGVTLKSGDVVYDKEIHFNKYESKIFEICNESPTVVKKLSPLTLNKEFEVVGSPTNHMILDFLTYSKDGKNYSEKLHYMGVFNKLLEERYTGDVYLKYEFNVKDIPSICDGLIEDTRTKEVYINGVKVDKTGYVLEKDLHKYEFAKYLKEGINEVVVKIDFYEGENVYYALFGENVQESIKNCLAYDCTIEAMYLQGNFGVYGDLKPSEKVPNVMIGENFYLGKQKKVITSLIEDGFPFFRGKIRLAQKINVNDTDKELVINDRFQSLDLTINNNYLGKMMFNYKLDVSKYLKTGENDIVMDLVVSNRNLLGPHHTPQEEDLAVGPFSFERPNQWKDGKCANLRENYSFVKTII